LVLPKKLNYNIHRTVNNQHCKQKMSYDIVKLSVPFSALRSSLERCSIITKQFGPDMLRRK